jgi:hypothetical protein
LGGSNGKFVSDKLQEAGISQVGAGRDCCETEGHHKVIDLCHLINVQIWLAVMGEGKDA